MLTTQQHVEKLFPHRAITEYSQFSIVHIDSPDKRLYDLIYHYTGCTISHLVSLHREHILCEGIGPWKDSIDFTIEVPLAGKPHRYLHSLHLFWYQDALDPLKRNIYLQLVCNDLSPLHEMLLEAREQESVSFKATYAVVEPLLTVEPDPEKTLA